MSFSRPMLLACAVVAVTLGGCTGTPVTEAPRERLILPTTPTVSARIEVFSHLPAEVDRSSWSFVRLGELSLPAAGKSGSARLDLQDGQMSGNTGCNGIFGSYQREDTRLQFTGAGISRKYCAALAEICWPTMLRASVLKASPRDCSVPSTSCGIMRFITRSFFIRCLRTSTQ